MTMGEMIKEIYNSTQSKSIPIVGSIQGNGTINISNTYANYKILTKEDFIISITSINSVPSTTVTAISGTYPQTYGVGGFNPSIEYDNKTGIITLTGLTQYITLSCWRGTNNQSIQNASANIYVNK